MQTITAPEVTGTVDLDDYTVTITEAEAAECQALADAGKFAESLNRFTTARIAWEVRTFGRKLSDAERIGTQPVVLTKAQR